MTDLRYRFCIINQMSGIKGFLLRPTKKTYYVICIKKNHVKNNLYPSTESIKHLDIIWKTRIPRCIRRNNSKKKQI